MKTYVYFEKNIDIKVNTGSASTAEDIHEIIMDILYRYYGVDDAIHFCIVDYEDYEMRLQHDAVLQPLA